MGLIGNKTLFHKLPLIRIGGTFASDIATIPNWHCKENSNKLVSVPEGYYVGGAWILPYTGRWSLAPTIFYTFSGDDAGYGQWIDWSKRAAGLTGCTEEVRTLAAEAGLDYLYLREGVGSLQAHALRGCAEARQLYSANGVSIWLWEVNSMEN